ncbi:terminase [Streptomyces gilvus]|uniref:terminase n=1 Tax=Streptomyces gilvus TaxID=2920937 RepID=UPI001F117E72|nr:terminase [Streptomyces sp. CME 23]MCH5677838.1 terminase [Streptomyces sp. CME 23]
MTTTSTIWRPPTEFADQCRELYGLECPPLWGTPRRPEFPTLGGKVAKVMERLGYTPMPWQRYVWDVALELDPATMLPWYRHVGLSVPRQQGKTQGLLAVKVHRAQAWKRQRIIYAAQTRSMARERWEDEFWATIELSRLARRFVIRKANGHEAIIARQTRSKIGITANTEKAGHGPPLDLGVMDELFAHEDDRLEQAFSPAMLTRPAAQLWWASAGGTEKSVPLNKKRQAGRALIEELWKRGLVDADFPHTAYFEWFAPEDMDRADPATWRATLPALGHTVTEAVIQHELDTMDPAEFDRAYLNRTRKSSPPPDPNIPRERWAGLVDKTSKPVPARVALAVDVSQDRGYSSIAAASLRKDGKVHLEIIARRPGTDWVVPAVARLRKLWKPVAVAIASSGAPAGSLIDDLIAAGIDVPKDKEHPQRGDLAVMRTGDVTEACGQMADAMRQGTAVHIEQVPLTAAVNGARTRRNGDAWQLDRTSSLVDVSPLCAVTFARWALLIRGPQVEEDYDISDSFA